MTYRFEDWQRKATQDLKGKSLDSLKIQSEENIVIQPLYHAEQIDESLIYPSRRIDFKGHYQRTINAVYIDEKNIEIAREQAIYALSTGASALCLSWGGGVKEKGIQIRHIKQLERFFDGIWLDAIPVYFDLGEEYIEKIGILAKFLLKHYEHKAQNIDICLGIDPFALWVQQGVLREKIEVQLPQLFALYDTIKPLFPKLRLFEFNHGVYYNAGCDEAQDLAYSISSAIAMIKEIEKHSHWTMARCFEEIAFHLTVDSRFFHGIAKIRALKQLWARIQELCGLHEYIAPSIRLGFAKRFLSRYDSAVNMLRNTAVSFTAFIGGASVVYALPFDGDHGSELGFRIAKNTPMLLNLESHLHEVTDPAGGSFLIEKLTTDLCEQAWRIFQEIETIGFENALIEGKIQHAIEQKQQKKQQLVAKRKLAVTGVSEFPLLTEKPIKGTEISFANRIASNQIPSNQPKASRDEIDQCTPLEMREKIQKVLHQPQDFVMAWLDLCEYADIKALWMSRQSYDCYSPTIATLSLVPIAQDFERLRDRSEDFYAKHGHYPKVFVASFGTLSQHLPRTSFIKNLLEAGGFEAVLSNGDELLSVAMALQQCQEQNAKAIVICGSDHMIDPLAVELLKTCNQADIVQIWRAGAIKDDAVRQSYAQCSFPLTGTIAIGNDMPEILNRLWQVYEEQV